MARSVSINILGNPAQAIAALDAVGVKAEETAAKTDEVGESGSKSSSKLSQLGKVAALGALGIGLASIKMAADFQSSMTLLVTGAGESQSNLKMVSDGILKMAPEVGETTQQLASGMYLIESAGFHGAAGLSVLKAAAEGAKVGNADLSTVAGAVTTALTDYHLPAAQAADVTSALVQTVADGKTNMEDLGASLGKVMPQAAALGVSFQQVTGAMAVMTNTGLSAKNASQHLSNTILAMAAPNAVAQKSLAQVGLTAQQVKDTLADPSKGLAGAIQLIEDHVGKKFPAGSVASVSAFKDIMGGVTGYSTALMLGGKNMGAFEANVKNIGGALDKNSQTVQGFSSVQKDFNFQLDQARAYVEVLMIKLGTLLIPILEHLAKTVGNVVMWLTKHKTVAEALGVVIGTVLVAAFIAWAAAAATAAIATLAAAAPIIAIMAAVAALGAGIYLLATHWKQIWADIKQWMGDAWQFIRQHAMLIVGILTGPLGMAALWIGEHWKQIWDGMKTAASDFVNFFTAIPGEIVGIFAGLPGEIYSGVIQPIVRFFADLPSEVLRAVAGLGGDIVRAIEHDIPGGGIVGKAIGKIGGIFEDGGFVPGSGPQLAVVHGGEYVLTQSDVAGLQHPGGAGRFAATAAGGAGNEPAPSGDLVLQVNGQEFARVAGPTLRTWMLQGARRNSTRVGLA